MPISRAYTGPYDPFAGTQPFAPYQWPTATVTTTIINNPAPVTPTVDPKIEANTLYGKAMALCVLGIAKIGCSPAPIVGPYRNSGRCDFIVSFGVPANPAGNRKIYKIWLDQELWWSSVTGWDGSGAQPGDAIYHAETADIAFRPGTLTQAVLSLETEKFPGDENAYRPQMLLQIRNLLEQRYIDLSGRPVPYVAALIGDVTSGADPTDGLNLGEALERLAYSPWAGYTSSTFETVGITDVVPGILIKENFTVIQVCQQVTRDYRNIDLLQSDMLRMKDRGAVLSPDFIFDRDSVLADDIPIMVSRTGATTQRRERELFSVDPDQDYTAVPSLSKIPRDPFVISAAVGKESGSTPLIMDASTRQALVTYAHYYEDNARKKVSLKVRAFGFTIEPGDLFMLSDISDGFDDEVFKCTQTVHGANWIVEIEGEAVLRCQLGYTPPVYSFQNLYDAVFFSGTGPFLHRNTAVDLGAAASDRLIVLTIGAIRSIPSGRNIQSVTINGVAATIHEHIIKNGVPVTQPGSVTGAIASAVVPTGTTGLTVEIGTDGLVTALFFGVHRMTGLVSTVPFDSATGDAISSDPSLAVNVPAGGILIAGYAGCDPGGAVTWTGVNTVAYGEQIDPINNGFWGAGAQQTGMTAQTARTVSVTSPALGAETLVAASFR